LTSVKEIITETQKSLSLLKSSELSIGSGELKKRIPSKISAIHFTLSSPWIVSEAKVVKEAFPKDTRISRSYILGLLEKERNKLLSSTSDPVSVVEEKIFDVRLNGYSVSAWEGRETRDLEVTFAVSVIGTRMMEKFITECHPIVPARHISFHSSLVLQHVAIQILSPGLDNYCLLNIHGELTDFTLVHHCSCAFFGSFAHGVRTTVRKLALASNIDEHTADSLITLFTGGQLDSAHGKETIDLVDKILNTWGSDFQKVLTQGLADLPVLSSIIFSALSHDDFYAKELKNIFPNVRIQLLSIDEIVNRVDFLEKSERRRLTCLYAIAINAII
jgi:hypothetical protein